MRKIHIGIVIEQYGRTEKEYQGETLEHSCDIQNKHITDSLINKLYGTQHFDTKVKLSVGQEHFLINFFTSLLPIQNTTNLIGIRVFQLNGLHSTHIV